MMEIEVLNNTLIVNTDNVKGVLVIDDQNTFYVKTTGKKTYTIKVPAGVYIVSFTSDDNILMLTVEELEIVEVFPAKLKGKAKKIADLIKNTPDVQTKTRLFQQYKYLFYESKTV